MWMRLLRVVCGLLLLVTLPLGVCVFIISYILTGNGLFDDIMDWILWDATI